jgi:hypothetical protein
MIGSPLSLLIAAGAQRLKLDDLGVIDEQTDLIAVVLDVPLCRACERDGPRTAMLLASATLSKL